MDYSDTSKQQEVVDRRDARMNEVDERAWNRSIDFAVQKEDGQTTRLEGWLTLREGPRPSDDVRDQSEHRKEYGYGNERDATHIIAYSLGGPTAETSSAATRDNLIAADARVNRSYLAGTESYIREQLAEGKAIYCQADVEYRTNNDTGAKEPKTIVQRFYEQDESGKPRLLHEALANVSIDRPSQTRFEALDGTDAKKSSDFDRDGPIGTHRSPFGAH